MENSIKAYKEFIKQLKKDEDYMRFVTESQRPVYEEVTTTRTCTKTKDKVKVLVVKKKLVRYHIPKVVYGFNRLANKKLK